VHTEAIDYISGRADPLAALFILLCLIFYLKYLRRENLSSFILMLLSCVLAFLSRENSLILALLILLYHYASRRKIEPKAFLPIAGITFLYVLLRVTVLRFSLSKYHYVVPHSFWERILSFFAAITNYMRLMILPLDLHMEYGDVLFNFLHPKVLLGIAILSLLLFYAVKKRNSNKFTFFSLSWFLLALLPVSNLYPINAYMAEHWLYLPSLGLFILLAKALSSAYKIKKFKIVSVVAISFLIAFYSYLTIKQNSYWREPIRFYERIIKYAPFSYRAYYNLGLVYERMGKKELAEAQYRKTLELKPDHAEANNNLGIQYFQQGRQQESIEFFQRAIESNPDYADAYNNLANVYFVSGERDKAMAQYKKTIELNPLCAEAYSGLGAIYSQIGKDEEAMSLLKKAIEINPALAQAYNNLASIYFQNKQYKLAIEYCDKAKELGLADQILIEDLKPYR
jgi:tetratricopeptide (TPR) repeat protein